MKKIRKECNFKTLSAAILTGCAIVGMGNTVQAADLSEIDLSQKPVETPTLDYLKDNNILIPQKGEYNSTDKTWAEADPIQSSGSAYTITEGTAYDFTFEYKTADSDGNITTTYHKINLNLDETNLGTASSIKWTKLDSKPSTGTENVVEVRVSDTETHYYSYEYTSPEGYTKTGYGYKSPNSGGDNGIIADYLDNVEYDSSNFPAWGNGDGYSYGGAIYNANGNDNNITGQFINNKASSIDYSSYGGAVCNYANNLYPNYNAKIGNITGDFINNKAVTKGSYAYGGAIHNISDPGRGNATIGNITGNFIGNYVDASSDAFGGAISNINKGSGISKIGDITGDFVGNSAKGRDTYGGAIYNQNSVIGNITGNFISNSSEGRITSGGTIYNKAGTIGNITGDFINNYAHSTSRNDGGVIYNSEGKIGDITGDFVKNYGHSDTSYAYGGVIYNYAAVKDVTSEIGNISGDFISNSISSDTKSAYGGALCNLSNNSVAKFNNITGNFIGNKVSSVELVYGGAIHNTAMKGGTSQIGNINANFQNNTITNTNNAADAYGGAISNNSDAASKVIIGNISGDFINNKGIGRSVFGGAIFNGYGEIGNISGNFNSNSASGKQAHGGAIYNKNSKIGNIDGSFVNNSISSSGDAVNSYGGAIFNTDSKIGNICADFSKNSALSKTRYASGGAIYNYAGGSELTKTGDITGKFVGNIATTESDTYSASGGAIYNYGATPENAEMGNINGEFINNSAKGGYAYGGAIYNRGVIKSVSGNFIGNSAISKGSSPARGGAIFTMSDLNIIANNGSNTIFKDNYTETNGVKDDNAIWLQKDGSGTLPTLTLNAETNGNIAIHDNINGSEGYKINITGDGTGKVMFGNYVANANITTNDGSVSVLSKDSNWNHNNVTLNGGTLSMLNTNAGVAAFDKLTVSADTNFIADVDLANKQMDRINAKEYGEHQGSINIVGMNLLSDSKSDKTEILFADKDLKDFVSNGTVELPDENQMVAFTPIYKYRVAYDNKADGGYFVFNRGGSAGGNPSNAFNPAILASPVSTIAASQSTINETFKHVFEHADSFTQLPFNERKSMMNQNKYAITDFNSNIPYNALKNSAGWFRPYVTFENINLKNGPKVGAITYGSLAGFDTDFYEHKNGWHSVGTGYIGYNGSNMNYTGVDINANGGILGYTHTMYKGNFWSALTVNAGATTGQIRTMYGKDDFTSLLAGVGSKTGYNFEFKEGKFIFQPIMFMSYSFVNTFDYTNAGGVRIDNKPAHSIQLNPSMRFIANTKNGWQPYAQVGMVWNVLNSSDAFANNIKLPSMSVKPYIEYGLGIQRTWKDYFTAFGQVMMRNGGRNGVAMTGGIRWALGRDNNTEKVQNNTQKKVVKQLTPEQKVALGKQYNTTRTTSAAVLKQL